MTLPSTRSVPGFDAIRRAILSVNRYEVGTAREELRRSINELRTEDAPSADYLQILADYSFGDSSYEEVVGRLKALVGRSRESPRATAHAYLYLAKLSLKQRPVEEHYDYRRKAIEIARRHDLHLVELVALANWAIAALELGDKATAESRSNEAMRKLSLLPRDVASDAAVSEVRGRLNAIRGKVILKLLNAADPSSHVAQRFREARELYETALELDNTNAHRQVNTRIEFALETLSLPKPFPEILLPAMAEVLEDAHAGLNAHQCDSCRAFYYEAQTVAARIQGNSYRRLSSQLAVDSWTKALRYSERRREHLAILGHPEEAEAQKMMEDLEELVAREQRPRRIFLSHSGKDKALVRQFSRALSVLGFDPWLDEEAMTAGVLLERGLRQGMAESCAAVFFITPDFVDRDYLATEIDYAIEEKRKRGKHFSIVTLVLSPLGAREVPSLLRRFVWKEPVNELDALIELIRSLPLRSSRPTWRDD